MTPHSRSRRCRWPPLPVAGVIYHSDRGSEEVHRRQVRRDLQGPGRRAVDGPGRVRARQRRGRGVPQHLKVEFVHRQHFTTRAEARIKISTWIADFYNTTRRHTANDGLAPITFEDQMPEARRRPTALLRAEVA